MKIDNLILNNIVPGQFNILKSDNHNTSRNHNILWEIPLSEINM